MKFNKTTMSLALTAAMFGSVALTQQAFADAVDARAAQTSMTDTRGDILLYPYYSIDKGFRTLFHLVNSSDTDTTIVKVRLRDYKNSDDVLDFTVIMSPNDVFAGTIRDIDPDNPKGEVIFRKANDTTCTSPNKSSFLPGHAIKTGSAGHIEVITMATINNDVANETYLDVDGIVKDRYPDLKKIVNAAKHDSNGENSTADCSTVDSYFSESKIGDLQKDLVKYVNAANGGDDPAAQMARAEFPAYKSNLFGHYTIVDFDHGIQGGGRPSTIWGALDSVKLNDDSTYEYDNTQDLHSPCDKTGSPTTNVTNICGQYDAHFEFPNLVHVEGVNVDNEANAGDNAAFFNSVFGVKNLSKSGTLASLGIMNEWSKNSNALSTVESEWVVTLPVKYVYKDNYPASTTGADMQSTFTGTRYDSSATPAENMWNDVVAALFDDDFAGDDDPDYVIFDSKGCSSYSTFKFDREEQTSSSGTSTSGGQAEAGVGYCNEVSTITFGDHNGVTHDASHGVVFGIDTENLNQKFGWGGFGIKDKQGNRVSLPILGYSMWKRDFGAPGTSYGHIMDHVKVTRAEVYLGTVNGH